MLGWRPPAEKVMSCTHWEVQIIIELMISTRPDSSDGRALDMQSEGLGFKSQSELKFLKALVWRLHVRFPCNYLQKWVILNLELIYIVPTQNFLNIIYRYIHIYIK